MYEHDPLDIPVIPERDFVLEKMPASEGKPPGKPLPPIPPRMKDWSKCLLHLKPKEANKLQTKEILKELQVDYLMDINKQYLAQTQKPVQ